MNDAIYIYIYISDFGFGYFNGTMKFFLRPFPSQEAESDAEREAMIQAAADAQQAKEDAELAARDAARRRLMEQVDAIRQEQIFYKQQQR